MDFYRPWSDYKAGFGDLCEYWLGLETLHNLTSTHNYSLRVDMEDWSSNWLWSEFGMVSIADEASKYRLDVDYYNVKIAYNHFKES